jgi:hypothetical protein
MAQLMFNLFEDTVTLARMQANVASLLLLLQAAHAAAAAAEINLVLAKQTQAYGYQAPQVRRAAAALRSGADYCCHFTEHMSADRAPCWTTAFAAVLFACLDPASAAAVLVCADCTMSAASSALP